MVDVPFELRRIRGHGLAWQGRRGHCGSAAVPPVIDRRAERRDIFRFMVASLHMAPAHRTDFFGSGPSSSDTVQGLLLETTDLIPYNQWRGGNKGLLRNCAPEELECLTNEGQGHGVLLQVLGEPVCGGLDPGGL